MTIVVNMNIDCRDNPPSAAVARMIRGRMQSPVPTK